MFNLNEQAAAAAAQEAGVTVDLIAPGGKDVLARITLAGPDSRRAIEARREAWRHVFAKREGDKTEIGDAETKEAGTRFLAGCVISWDGFTADGEAPLDCTLDNVLAVFGQVPWVESACDLKIGNRANFTQA